tara:strand:- start:1254 stop:1589 length:336 start_codon:yes stop_codon:yes gene_type:complete
MSNQLFIKAVPKYIVTDFIKTYGYVHNDYYLFSKASFKKARLEKAIVPFCVSLKNYYYKAKQFYVTRPMTYRNCITILRQLCKYHCIPLTSRTRYMKSTYEISYHFYIDKD